MLITDLHHFLDLPDDAPGPARRLAEHLHNIVRAATAGDTRTSWETALGCRRRPGNRRCPGRMIVSHTGPGTPIRWQCSACGDDGIISNWEQTPFDLRRRRLTVAGEVREIIIPTEAAAALRELQLLDPDSERLVHAARAHHGGGVLLTASDDELDELIGSVAAEANHEPNRRRQQRLDTAYDALTAATSDSW